MSRKLIEVYANILYIRFTDTFASLPAKAINAVSPVNVWLRLGRVLLWTGRLFLNLFLPQKNRENITGKIWLYVVSKNNYESLAFLQDSLPQTVMVAGQNKQIGIYNKKVNRLTTRFKIKYLYQFPGLLWGLYKIKGARALRFFDLIFAAVGYFELSLKYLQQYRPQVIIFANDHNTDPRALLLAAKELNIPTIYIQHASVSTSFPPLMFGLNLLEGQDALDKYQQCGLISGVVKFIGMPKADKFILNKNSSTRIQHLGICVNIIDDLNAVRDLLFFLSHRQPTFNISIRPHPSDNRDYSFISELGTTISLSNSKIEPAFHYLIMQDAIIAADSSIHLEAVMLNITSFYYRFNAGNFVYDYYGYVQHGLAEAADTPEQLAALLNQYKENRPQVYQKANYYNAVMGTENEGKSHALALGYIQDFIKQNQKIV